MFPSLSRTTPQTQATTSFVATATITIVPTTPFTILVNGQPPANPNSVNAAVGDTVTAVITTPDDYVWYKFYYYTINDVPQTFAVVNKSLYQVHVKPDDTKLRWYLYPATEHTLTFKSSTGINSPVTLGSAFDNITSDVHVVLDPLSDSVYFYNNFGIQLSKVTLPAPPIAYAKVPDRQTVVVLVLGGVAYEIYLNSSAFGIAPFFAKRNYSEFNDTTFLTQLPGEDLITYLRRSRAKKAIPPATCLTYNGTHLWAAGNGSIWVVDPHDDFRLLYTFDIDEYVLNIAPLPNMAGAVLVCQSQKVYTIDYTGTLTEIYTGTAVWEPALFNNKIYIPEGEIGFLKVYNPATQSFEADIALTEFSPSYTQVVDNKLYVCGHDNETVLVFDTNMNQTKLSFPNKVTWISVVGNSYIASHWLKNFKLLDVKDLYRIVGIYFRSRSGPVSHIGTDESLVVPLGNEEVFAHTPDNSWLWVNGLRTYSNSTRGTALYEGDYIALNYSARVPGRARTNCVVGDTAYDYDIEAVTETYFPRNIDLPIQAPQNLGIHTRIITLPRFFTPCRMSIEFGSIKVNNIYYYGDTVVNPGDIVSVEINTRGSSALPILTIGARQFGVPISVNLSSNIAPIVNSQINLDPGTGVNFAVTITERGSQFDYIIPGYYDIIVKKGNIDITGNYYQQFGKDDILTVQFISSPKLYDQRNVYILGLDNYEFTAKNKVPPTIDYLDFGNLLLPYTRQLDTYFTGNTITLGAFNIDYYETPEIQFTTANLTVSGLDPSLQGNLSVLGGDSYIVLNGNLVESSSNIIVANGDNVALARNVVNYFDVPVRVVQIVPTGDDDGFAEAQVGSWGLVNRTINPVQYADRSLENVTNTAVDAESDIASAMNRIETAFELSRLPLRKVNSSLENLEWVKTARATSLIIDSSPVNVETIISSNVNKEIAVTRKIFSSEIKLADADNLIKSKNFSDFGMPTNSKIYSSTGENYQAPAPTGETKKYQRSYSGERNIFSYETQFDYAQIFKLNGYTQEFYRTNEEIADAAKSNFDYSKDMRIKAATISFVRPSQRTAFSSDSKLIFDNWSKNIASTASFVEQTSDKNLLGYRFNQLQNQDSLILGSTPKDLISILSIVLGSQVKFNNTMASLENAALGLIDKNSDQKVQVSTVLFNFVNYTVDLVSLAKIESEPNQLKHILLPVYSQLGEYIDRLYSWQGFLQSFVMEKDPVATIDSRIDSDRLIKQIPAETRNEDYTFQSTVYVRQELENFIFNKTVTEGPPEIDYIFFSKQDIILKESNYNYIFEPEIPIKVSTGEEIFVGTKFNTFGTNATNSFNPFEARHEDPTFVQTIWQPLIFAKPTNAVTEPHRAPEDNYIINYEIGQQLVSNYTTAYESFEAEVQPLSPDVYIDYEKDFAPNYKNIATNYQPEDNKHEYNIRMNWTDLEDMPAGSVPMNYVQEDLRDHTSRLTFHREKEYPGVTSHVDVEKLVTEISGQVYMDYVLHRNPEVGHDKIKAERERPQYYYLRYLTVPEFDQGEVWNNDIEVEYGAFLTEADAVLAASKYTSFRPYLIMDTNLWTYRVLLDTGLVCPLPKGRYPIAWLLHGG